MLTWVSVLNSRDHPLWNGLLPIFTRINAWWLQKMTHQNMQRSEANLRYWSFTSVMRWPFTHCFTQQAICQLLISPQQHKGHRCMLLSDRLYVGSGIGTQDSCLCGKHITHWAMSLAPQVLLAYFILNRFILNLWQFREANLISLGGYSLSWVYSVTHTSR